MCKGWTSLDGNINKTKKGDVTEFTSKENLIKKKLYLQSWQNLIGPKDPMQFWAPGCNPLQGLEVQNENWGDLLSMDINYGQ